MKGQLAVLGLAYVWVGMGLSGSSGRSGEERCAGLGKAPSNDLAGLETPAEELVSCAR